MVTASAVRVAAHCADEVGEGPIWVAEHQALYWVDVLGQCVHRLSLADATLAHATLTHWAMPEPVGFIIPCKGAGSFIVGLKSGLYMFEPTPFRLTPLLQLEPDSPDNRLNDSKADAKGRLWTGTMAMDADRPEGALYCVEPSLEWRAVDSGYIVPNGPAFASDACMAYHADSPRRLVYRLRLDDSGSLIDKDVFLRFENDWGVPDGMTVDRQDHLWIAHWDGGRISRFDPDGRRVCSIELPASRITSLAFAGPDLDRLFVTSARMDRAHEPLAGALFEVDAGVTGRAPCYFGA